MAAHNLCELPLRTFVNTLCQLPNATTGNAAGKGKLAPTARQLNSTASTGTPSGMPATFLDSVGTPRGRYRALLGHAAGISGEKAVLF
jgi:hypothetical protein